MSFELVEISPHDENTLAVLHRWYAAEPERDHFTCRPLAPVKGLEEYLQMTKEGLEQRRFRIFVLTGPDGISYGKITAFDYNSRNQSSEFGYYFPHVHRGKGYGRIAVEQFLNMMFDDDEWVLNKIYATTASGNVSSIKLLKYFRFHLDGRLREHYWIAGQVQDQLHFSLLRREHVERAFKSSVSKSMYNQQLAAEAIDHRNHHSLR